MTSPVDWALAERIATRLTPRDPFAASYLYGSLSADFDECTAEAEELVEAETGLRSLAGPARARVVDRPGVGAGQRPRLPAPPAPDPRAARRPRRQRARPFRSAITRKVSAFEVGQPAGLDVGARARASTTCWWSTTTRPPSRTSCTTSAPTCSAWSGATASRRGSSACGWRSTRSPTGPSSPACRGCASTTSGWSQQALSMVDTDPGQLLSALRSAASGLRQGRDAFDLGGLAAVIASEEQRVALGKVGRAHGAARGPRRRHDGPRRGGPCALGRAVQPGPAGAAQDRRRRWPGPSAG